MYSKESIKKLVKKGFIGKSIIFLDEVNSTNTYAKENASLPEGTVFVANRQLGGRGRLGKSFSSCTPDGLWFTILLKPKIKPAFIPCLTLIAGLSVSKAMGENALIKWPNDIIINKKKVCGILTETSFLGEKISYAIVGIGINLNNTAFPEELSHIATSLKIENSEEYDKSSFLSKVLDSFSLYYGKFIKFGFSSLAEEYEKKCITVNSEIVVEDGDTTFQARATGISNDGKLLALRDGKKISIEFGQVSVRGLLGYA